MECWRTFPWQVARHHLQIARWQGRARLHEGKIEIEKAAMVSSGGVYEISGTASFGQVLDFKLIAAPEMKAAGAVSFGL